MSTFTLIAGMLFVAIALIAGNVTIGLEAQEQQDAIVYAQHIEAYGGFVAGYARSNPTATGSIADATAGVPTWFTRFPAVANVVSAGKAYAWFVPANQAQGFAIARSARPFVAGVKIAGRLQPPGEPVGQVLPSSIPDGALVVVR
jgi:hypothetical protein